MFPTLYLNSIPLWSNYKSRSGSVSYSGRESDSGIFLWTMIRIHNRSWICNQIQIWSRLGIRTGFGTTICTFWPDLDPACQKVQRCVRYVLSHLGTEFERGEGGGMIGHAEILTREWSQNLEEKKNTCYKHFNIVQDRSLGTDTSIPVNIIIMFPAPDILYFSYR
jgi:hypothetical protein